MADILHEEIFSSLNFRVQSCSRTAPPCPLLLHHCYKKSPLKEDLSIKDKTAGPEGGLIKRFHCNPLHKDSDLDPDSDWLHLHEGIVDSNPDSHHAPLFPMRIVIRIRILVLIR